MSLRYTTNLQAEPTAPPLQGFTVALCLFPGLAPWAFLRRPFGAHPAQDFGGGGEFRESQPEGLDGKRALVLDLLERVEGLLPVHGGFSRGAEPPRRTRSGSSELGATKAD